MVSDSARLSVVIESQYQGGPGLEALRRDARAAGVTLQQVSVQTREVATATGQAVQQVARLQGFASGTLADFHRQEAQRLAQALPAGGRVGVTGPDISAIARQQAQAEDQADAAAIASEQRALAQVSSARQRAAQQAERDIARLTAVQERESQKQVNAIGRSIEQASAARDRDAAKAQVVAEKQAAAEIAAQAQALAQGSLIRERLASGGAVRFDVTGFSSQRMQEFQRNFGLAGVEVEQLGAKVSRTGQVIRTLQAAPGRGGVQPEALRLIGDALQTAEVSGVRLAETMGPKLAAGLRISSEEMSKLAQGIGHGLGLFSSFGAGIGTTVVVAAITAAIASAAKEFGEFDRQVRGTNALLGLTGPTGEQSFRQMEAAVRDFAVGTGTDATDAAKGLYDTISAGIPVGRDAFTVLGAGAQAAIGGLTTTATAVDGITTVLNAYHLSAQDATRVSDEMFQTVNVGKIRFDELSHVIGTVVPISSALGVSFAEVGGLLANATNQGVQAGAAVEGMRAALNAFLRPTAEAQKIASDLGVSFGASAVQAKGFQGALADVVRATGGNEQLLGRLFGDVQAVSFVLASTGQNATRAASAIDRVGNSAGATSKAADEVNKSLGRSFDQMGARFTELRLHLGDLSAGPLKEVISQTIQLGELLRLWPAASPPQTQVDRITEFAQQTREAAKAEQDRRQVQGPPAPTTAAPTGLLQRAFAANPTIVAAGVTAASAVGLGGVASAAVFAVEGKQAKDDAAKATQRQADAQAYLNAVNAAGSQRQLELNQMRESGKIGLDEWVRLTVEASEDIQEYNRRLAEGDSITMEGVRAEREATQAVRDHADGQKDLAAAQIAVRDNALKAFAPQESAIALQSAGVQAEIAGVRTKTLADGKVVLSDDEARLQVLQAQLRTIDAQRDSVAALADQQRVANLDLERVQLEQSHTRERALDLESQNLSALEQRNQARREGIRLGIVAPILQRVATAAGANVDPDSPEFQHLTMAQQFIALAASDAQAALRRTQIATDPGKTALDNEKNRLDFARTTANLAVEELNARIAIDKLPVEGKIRVIEKAQADLLAPLNAQLLIYQAQSAQLDKQKAQIQWIIEHIPGAELNPLLAPEITAQLSALVQGGTLTPETQKAVQEAVDRAINHFFPGGTTTPPAVDTAAQAAAQKAADDAKAAADKAGADATNATAGTTAPTTVEGQPIPDPAVVAAAVEAQRQQDAANAGGTAGTATVPPPLLLTAPETASPPSVLAIPESQAPPNTIVPGGEIPTSPLGEAPPGVSAATRLASEAVLRVPTIRGTGVSQAQNITLNQHVNVDASNQTDPHAIATATATMAAGAAVDALSGEFDAAPSSDSAGARY